MAALALLLAIAVRAPVLSLTQKPRLLIAGSSTVYPVALAWSNATQVASQYDITVEGGGSSTGAERVCLPRSDPAHVDIGCMSRDWKDKEAVRLDDEYTLECLETKIRVTQVMVGVDGLAVVVAKNGVAHNCLMLASMGGLTLAQLRWVFSDWTNSSLAADGLELGSVIPNDDGDRIKEWSDLNQECAEVPIHPYGPGNLSGTRDFFGEVVFCKNCFKEKTGYVPESFHICDYVVQHTLEGYTSADDLESFLRTQRPHNCYVGSEDDEKILQWILADGGGIGYFGFAYFAPNYAQLTTVPIADDRSKGAQDTLNAKVEPSFYSITDGSYVVFTRSLYMNVDNLAWPVVRGFLDYGFSDGGQDQVALTGYVPINFNLRNKMWQRIAEEGNSEADYAPVKPDMCWNGTEIRSEEYTNRFGRTKLRYACEHCPAGRSKRSNTNTPCLPCAMGSFASTSGQSRCEFCRAGRFAAPGAASCTACPRNSAAAAPGQGSCTACGPGEHAAQEGTTACKRCGAGRYRSATDAACTRCPEGRTTGFEAATGPEDCVCEGDSFSDTSGSCQTCPKGMACPLGSDVRNYGFGHAGHADSSKRQGRPVPVLQEGFYATAEEPLSVYQCVPASSCPGGVPGTCPGGLEGVGCARCPSGQQIVNGTCEPCTGLDGVVVLFWGLPIAMLGLTVAHVLNNWPAVRGSKPVVIAVFFFSMAVTVLLTISIFGTLDVMWAPPLSFVIKVFSIFRLDLKIIGLSCMIGQSFVAEYAIRLLAFPAACALALAGSGLLYLLPMTRQLAGLNVAAFQNTAGFLMSALFIFMSLISMEGLRCLENPNGRFTLLADSSIMCWEGGEHTSIVLVSISALLLYPVLFMALVAYASFFYGSLTAKHGIAFTGRTRFLTSRMHPDCVVFAFWWNARNFALSLVPVIFSNNYGAAVCLLLAVLLTWMVFQTKYQCWRFEVLNWTDAIANVEQVMLLCLITLLPSQAVEEAAVGWCIVAMLICLVFFLLALSLASTVVHFRKIPRYDVFLTHHKAAAALFARHLKTLLLSIEQSLNVFLDVDELDSLDNLGFAVKQTRKLLIILTSDVLRRPWCAVEIGTAFLNKVSIGIVQLNGSQVDLVQGYLNEVIHSFSHEDCSVFAMMGFTLDDLMNAYRHVAGLPRTTLPLSTPDELVQLQAVRSAAGEEVLGIAKTWPGQGTSSSPPADPEKMVYMVHGAGNEAQTSAAFLLMKLFRERLWDAHLCRQRSGDKAEAGQSFKLHTCRWQKCVAVILVSRGLPEDPVALGAITALKRAGLGVVTVLSQEDFSKPSEDFFQGLIDESLVTSHQRTVIGELAPGFVGKEVAEALRSIYKILAWHFSPEQNLRLMMQEFGIIEERAAKELDKCTRRPRTPTRPSTASSSSAVQPVVDQRLQGSKDTAEWDVLSI